MTDIRELIALLENTHPDLFEPIDAAERALEGLYKERRVAVLHKDVVRIDTQIRQFQCTVMTYQSQIGKHIADIRRLKAVRP